MARTRWLARVSAVAALALLPALAGGAVSADVGRTQSYTAADGRTLTYTLTDVAAAPLLQLDPTPDLHGATFSADLADGTYELDSPAGHPVDPAPTLTVTAGVGTVDLAGGTWTQYARINVCDTADTAFAECTTLLSGVFFPDAGVTGADADYMIGGEFAWLWGDPVYLMTTLPDGEYTVSGGDSLGECNALNTTPTAVVAGGVLEISGLKLCGEQPATAWEITVSGGPSALALQRVWIADGTKFLGTEPPECDPAVDPTCVPEPCDPAVDPTCVPEPCDPAVDPTCVPEPCDPAVDPTCVPEPCDPAVDPTCVPEPCDPAVDPTCVPEPCDPAVDPTCVPEPCDPAVDPTCDMFEGEYPEDGFPGDGGFGEFPLDPGPMVLEGEAWFLNPDGQAVIILRDDSKVALRLGASIDDEVATSMTLSGYPAGMRWNASTQTLSGTPYSRSTYVMTAVFTYPSGRTQTLEYFVNIAGDPQAAQVRFDTMSEAQIRGAVG